MREYSRKEYQATSVDDERVEEVVFCIPSQHLSHIKDGFTPATEKDYEYLIRHGRYFSHKDVTDRIEFQQIVPCIWIQGISGQSFVRLVRNHSQSFTKKVLMQKTHVMQADRGVNPILNSTKRLLEGRLVTPQPFSLKFLGYARDSQSRKDHLGLVYQLQCRTKKSVRLRNPENTGKNWTWYTEEELIDEYFTFEDPWDKLVINEVFKTVRSRKEDK